MSLKISTQSTEYVKVQVTRDNGSDPTTDTVAMAFVADGVTPSVGDFKSSSWQTINGKYFARCLIGPTGVVQLTAGLYVVWVKVTDSPEVPVKRVDFLEII
jgi:hypothetical protein